MLGIANDCLNCALASGPFPFTNFDALHFLVGQLNIGVPEIRFDLIR